MKKQFFLIAMLLCGIFLPATAQEIVSMDIEGPSNVCEIDLRDLMYAKQVSDSPLKARQYAEPSEAVVNYKDRITNMPQYLHDFIDQYVEAGRIVLDGGSSWLSNPELGQVASNGYYYLLKDVTGTADFTFPVGTTDVNVIRQAAADAYSGIYNEEYDILQSFMPYACLCIDYDHPEIFWIGSHFRYGASGGASISYDPSAGTGTATYSIKLILFLQTNGFDIRCNSVTATPYYFRDPTNIANAVQKFNNSVQNIVAQCETYPSRYEKLLAAHDWLTQHNCYNPYFPALSQSDIGDIPWSAFSAIEGNGDRQGPVCEGYSRAYKVLCDAMEIPCILMSGIAFSDDFENHMWNYVQMDDEKWYAVDVTWDDPIVNGIYQIVSGKESQKWFLLGSTTEVKEGLTFIESHPEQWSDKYPNKGTLAWDLQPGPELSETAWVSETTYILTYIVDGEVYQTYEVEYGEPISPEPIPEKEGYTFSGWSEIPETMPDHDVTVTGSFIVNSYTLTYIVDGMEYLTLAVDYGTPLTPETDPTKEGYTFSGWSEIPETMPAEDVIVFGSFVINTYILTYKIDGEEYKSYEVEYDAPIIPEPDPIKEGYTFSGWSEIPERMPANDVTVTGWFIKIILGKCATPTISYVDHKLKFSCETEDVKFFSAIKDDDIRLYDTDEIELSVTYTITVIATKDDYDNSDEATATLCWVEQQPTTEGITDEDAIMEMKALPVLIQSQGGIITIQGAAEGTPIAIYDTSGKKYGTTISGKDSATIATSLRPGSVAIVKLGEKSVKIVIK